MDAITRGVQDGVMVAVNVAAFIIVFVAFVWIVNNLLGLAPPINGAATQARTDGYIFGMLRNGRGLMPPQNRIPEEMRWDVVNYVRELQGE